MNNEHTNEQIHTPPPVTGYNKLPQSTVDLMNRVKAKGDELGKLIDELQAMDSNQVIDGVPHGIDKRWLSIGRTQCQQGIMAVIRSIAQPSNF